MQKRGIVNKNEFVIFKHSHCVWLGACVRFALQTYYGFWFVVYTRAIERIEAIKMSTKGARISVFALI